jgi:diguanylate cyclase (GGDEF)-like protein/PAS domain S-box-containing protein
MAIVRGRQYLDGLEGSAKRSEGVFMRTDWTKIWHTDPRASILNLVSLAVIRLDSQGLIVEFSEATETIYGYRASELARLDNPWRQALDRHRIVPRVTERGPIAGDLIALPIKAGGQIEVLLWACVVGDEVLLVTSGDVRHTGVHEAVSDAHDLVQRVVESADLCVFRQDYLHPERSYGTLGGDGIYGYTSKEFADDPELWRKVIHPEDAAGVVRVSPLAPTPLRTEYRIIRKDGAVRWIANTLFPSFSASGALMALEGITVDVTERHQLQEKLAVQAYQDVLTGMANRARFEADVAGELERVATEQPVGLLFIDFDGFKYINDTYGHQMGDQVLVAISTILVAFQSDRIQGYRMGGDEFAMLVRGVADPDVPVQLATAIVERFSAPLVVSGRSMLVPCSIGVSLYPDDGADADILTRHSDIAMYAAKEAGGRRVVRYSSQLISRYHDRVRGYDGLKRALSRREFLLYYQPLLDGTTKRIVGAEALLRWADPARGLVGAGEFIAQAEASGLIWDLGNWVCDEAFGQTKAWRDQGYPRLRMNVNVSMEQVAHPAFLEQILQTVEKHDLDPHCIELEITESLFMARDSVRIQAVLRQLQERGFRLAIDDFGSGFSSLQSLLDFAPNTLKIDRSLVEEIDRRPSARAVVSAIIRVTQELQMEVVAEGVERPEQGQCLQELGCDVVQGFLFSRPVPAHEFWAATSIIHR